MKLAFWLSAGLLVYAQAGYGVLLAALARLRRARTGRQPPSGGATERVADHRRLRRGGGDRREGRQRARARLPARAARGRSSPATARPTRPPQRAREAGADVVLELPRGGKIRAQDAAVERARGEIVAFSDANALWEPDALRALVDAVRRPARSATSAARCAFVNDGGAPTRRALYWRYEMWLRALESRLASVTGGQRRDLRDAARGLPRGRPDHGPRPVASRSTWSSAAGAPSTRRRRARPRRWCPTIEGEFARKRRMMSHAWPIVLRGGLLSRAATRRCYALMIASHRVLRYAPPFLHVVAFALNAALALGARAAVYARGRRARSCALLLAALAGRAPGRCSSRATTS